MWIQSRDLSRHTKYSVKEYSETSSSICNLPIVSETLNNRKLWKLEQLGTKGYGSIKSCKKISTLP